MPNLICAVPDTYRALPSVEFEDDINEQQRLDAMKEVDDVMQELPPREDGYIGHLGDLPKTRSRFYPEYEEKLEKNESISNGCFNKLSSIVTETPPPATSDVCDEFEVWNTCLNQIKIKIQYLTRQSENLELLNSCGMVLCEQSIRYYQALSNSIQDDLSKLVQSNGEVNSHWKTSQESVATYLTLLQKEWEELTSRNKESSTVKVL